MVVVFGTKCVYKVVQILFMYKSDICEYECLHKIGDACSRCLQGTRWVMHLKNSVGKRDCSFSSRYCFGE